eukprot:TRINITY_DN427_c0_g1_i1.p1 TRINITY_DN427_c0_g1~~TRINITY_DN427_c0_g1_i1.p1  ORF type:complete len:215 (-),score=49.42 TRINITY_DN427_c0_g1_i1:839-1453(-)
MARLGWIVLIACLCAVVYADEVASPSDVAKAETVPTVEAPPSAHEIPNVQETIARMREEQARIRADVETMLADRRREHEERMARYRSGDFTSDMKDPEQRIADAEARARRAMPRRGSGGMDNRDFLNNDRYGMRSGSNAGNARVFTDEDLNGNDFVHTRGGSEQREQRLRDRQDLLRDRQDPSRDRQDPRAAMRDRMRRQAMEL